MEIIRSPPEPLLCCRNLIPDGWPSLNSPRPYTMAHGR